MVTKRGWLLGLVALIIFGLSQQGYTALLLDKWVKRTNTDVPTNSTLYGITYGNGTYVAVGNSGTIISSSDGVNWVDRISNEIGSFRTVSYGNGVFVALGPYDVIQISTDGITWSDPGANLGHTYDVIFVEGRFVAVGNGIHSSEDGVTWRYDGGGMVSSIAYGDGMYVAAGSEIFTSVDGVNWIDRSIGISCQDVTYGEGKFVIVGSDRFLYSYDGILWFSSGQDIAEECFGITYGNNQFVAVGKNISCVSTNGIDWTTHFAPIPYAWAAIYANGMFWAVGDVGGICNSPDGKNWTISSKYSMPYENLTDICFGNGKYVAVGSGVMFASDDGIVWTTIDFSNGDYFYFQKRTALRQIIFRNGIFLVLGYLNQPSGGDRYPITLTSTNGVDWNIHPISFFPHYLMQLVATDDLLVAVGDYGQIATSVDGIGWTARDSQTSSHLIDITHANGMFVAVGSNDTMVTSMDGISWTRMSLGKYKNFSSIAYGNGVYVLIPTDMYQNNMYYTSTDGENWDAQSAGSENQQFYSYGIRFLNGRFFACSVNIPSLFSSPDGINWTNHNTKTPGNQLNNISFFNDKYLALGVGLTVLESENGTDWTILRYPCSVEIKSVAYGDGTFISTGGGGYWRSSQEPQWPSSTTNLGFGGVAYGNGRFVSPMAYSADGVSWTYNNSDIEVRNIAFGNGVFVGSAYVGYDIEQFYSSIDGVEWIPANYGPIAPVANITFANDRFFAQVNRTQGFLISFDGMNWGIIGTEVSFSAISYGNNMFLATSENDLYRSFDAITWTNSYSHPIPTVHFSKIAYGAEKFLIADSQGQFYSTPYGILVDQHYNSKTVINDIAFGNGTFVAVGHNGTIIQTIGDKPIIDDIVIDGCISELCKASIEVTATDPAGGNLSYVWTTDDGGSIIGSGNTVDFDPPNASLPPACLPFRVTVAVTSDESDLTTEQTMNVMVKLAGDANSDGVVNILDKVMVRNAFGSSGENSADVNCDNVVNILDKVVVRNQFGQAGCQCQ